MADSASTTNPYATRRAVVAGITAAPVAAQPAGAFAAVANPPEPVTTSEEERRELLCAYSEWLHYEQRLGR